MRVRPLAAAPCALAGLLCLAAPARAHAPPLGARLLEGPGGTDLIVTNRGLVFREPDGAARLLCNEALRVTTAELPSVAVLSDGALIVATSAGLRQSRDRGCTWADVGGMQYANAPALASAPSDPDTLYVATYDAMASAISVSHDGGTSWTLSLSADAGDYINSLLVASADATRVYGTVATYAPGQRPVFSLLHTRDGGGTWRRVPLALSDADYLAVAAATDPADAEVLLLFSIANSPGLDDGRLLISHDGGEHFEVALTRPEIRGAGVASDGRRWAAARDGLYGESAETGAFERTSAATELGCVSERDGELLVCGHYAGITSRAGVGISADVGQGFERYLDFAEVSEPVACPAESLTTALCARPWLDWQVEMLPGGAPSPDGAAPASALAPTLAPAAGEPAAARAAGPEPPSSGAASGGCALSQQPVCGAARLSVGAAFALWWWRRRQRRLPREDATI